MIFFCNKVDIVLRREFIDFITFIARARAWRDKRGIIKKLNKLSSYYTMMMIMLLKKLHKDKREIMQSEEGKFLNN